MLSFTFFPFTSILHTRKSTPIVAEASSSGSHCSSVNLKSKLLFPTEEFPLKWGQTRRAQRTLRGAPMSSSLQLTAAMGGWGGAGAPADAAFTRSESSDRTFKPCPTPTSTRCRIPLILHSCFLFYTIYRPSLSLPPHVPDRPRRLQRRTKRATHGCRQTIHLHLCSRLTHLVLWSPSTGRMGDGSC